MFGLDGTVYRVWCIVYNIKSPVHAVECRVPLEAVAWLALVAVRRRLCMEKLVVGRARELCMW